MHNEYPEPVYFTLMQQFNDPHYLEGNELKKVIWERNSGAAKVEFVTNTISKNFSDLKWKDILAMKSINIIEQNGGLFITYRSSYILLVAP